MFSMNLRRSCGNSNFLREDRFREHIVKSASYVQEGCRDNFIRQKICMDVVYESNQAVCAPVHLFLR